MRAIAFKISVRLRERNISCLVGRYSVLNEVILQRGNHANSGFRMMRLINLCFQQLNFLSFHHDFVLFVCPTET